MKFSFHPFSLHDQTLPMTEPLITQFSITMKHDTNNMTHMKHSFLFSLDSTHPNPTVFITYS